MKVDALGNLLHQERDILNLIYNRSLNNFESIVVDPSDEVNNFFNKLELTPKKTFELEITEFDRANQDCWFIPEEYKNMDIEGYLVHVCPKENYQRLIEELQEYRDKNLLPLLKTLKYLVDIFRKYNVLWGVGRGSSVSSYVLFLIGIHKIDSVKYKLDYKEFLR